MTIFNRSLVYLASLVAPFCLAQNGDLKDSPGTVQTEVWKEMDVPPAPIVSPEEALAGIRVREGFSVELVASEPLVNDPVAMTWDENGRIWVTEMWAFMPDPDGNGEEEPVSRVVVLEDTDDDGTMDKSTVFLDQLVMPRAITIVDGGVLIADPPTLWYCQDTDGDLVCDTKEPVIDYAFRGDIEHSENGLVRNVDNWLYNAKSSRRFKFQDGKIVSEDTNFRGQWGITYDNYGRLFYNTNSSWVITDTIPWENASANPGHTPTTGFEIKLFEESQAFSDRINPGVNRGYTPDYLDEENRIRQPTAACGPTIYRGDTYPPEYRGNVFVPGPAINSVARFTLEDQGIDVIGTHMTEPHPKWSKVEFLGSTDERFRPVNSYTGPDGNLYIVDMYRGIIQHRVFLTTFLRKQIIERDLDKPVGLGRIYRVVHKSNQSNKPGPKLGDQTPLEWVQTLQHENGWHRDTAQRLLVQSAPHDDKTISALKELLRTGNELARIHTIWTLHGIGEWSVSALQEATTNASDWVTTHALRASEIFLKEENPSSLAIFNAALKHDSTRVRLQAFSNFRNANDPQTITNAWLNLTDSDRDNPYFIDCLVSNSSGHEIEIIVALSKEPDLAESKGTRNAFNFIVQALFKKGDTKVLTLVDTIEFESDLNWSDSILYVALEEVGNSKRMDSLNVSTKPSFLTKLEKSSNKELVDYAETVGRAFVWDGKEGVSKQALSKSDMKLFERGAEVYQQVCSLCHGNEGQGMTGLGPPLDRSPWVTEDDETVVLIVAHGLMGPVEVNGEIWNGVMPGHINHPNVDFHAFSSVITYIRNAWSNQAPSINRDKAREILAPYDGRATPWTVEELLKRAGN
ncbi:c-type cytochrome [Puniceicoccaceae bacterium K14]|nr:c-type cytochrome [Puniceicoccaceae bacterium K14]